MLNRKDIPSFKLPSGLNILQQSSKSLENGIPVHIVHGGTQDVAKIDIIFDAGVVQSNKPLVATFTNTLLHEGTETMSAYEIAEKIDYYGAYLGQSTNYHHAQITLYSLTKYLPNILPIIEDIIKKPSFNQHEFDVLLAKKKQDFLVDSEKVKTLANRKANEILFGTDHPYGRAPQLNHFDVIHLDDVKKFHKSQYSSNLCTIIISGQPGDDIIDLLNKHFGKNDWKNDNISDHHVKAFNPHAELSHLVDKEDAMQSAIKIVKRSITKSQPDYLELTILCTILGGYFGSRLMNNLREEKGLTYGISCYLVSFLKAGMFNISTEVVADKRELAVKEIFYEMERLRKELVPDEELTRVKNYMLGDLMRNLDGPFAVADAFRGLYGFELDLNFFKNLEQIIKNIDSEKIRAIANKHLIEDDFYVVIAGK